MESYDFIRILLFISKLSKTFLKFYAQVKRKQKSQVIRYILLTYDFKEHICEILDTPEVNQ